MIKRTKIFRQRKFKTTKYLRYENFLVPDELEGSLSSILPSQAIALANKEVEKVISEKGDTKKRGATRDGVSIRCVVGLPLSHRAKLLQELDSICFCTRIQDSLRSSSIRHARVSRVYTKFRS